MTSAVSALLVLVGAGAVVSRWREDPAADPLRLLPARPALEHAFHLDAVYARWIVRPVRAAARAVRWTDDHRRGRRHARRRPCGAAAGRPGGPRPDRQRQTYLTALLAGVLLLVAGVVVVT